MTVPPEMVEFWDHPAEILAVIDGDTADVDIRVGFGYLLRQRIRLMGLDTCEIRDKDPAKRLLAQRARRRVLDLAPVGSMVRVRTYGDARGIPQTEKYGRYLATLLVKTATGKLINVNLTLLNEGLAQPYDGGARPKAHDAVKAQRPRRTRLGKRRTP